jgi:hypothetical protein
MEPTPINDSSLLDFLPPQPEDTQPEDTQPEDTQPEETQPEDTGFNMTEWLRQAKETKGRKEPIMYEPPYEQEDTLFQSYKPKQKLLVEPKKEEPSFIGIYQPEEDQELPKEVKAPEVENIPIPTLTPKKESNRIKLINEITGIMNELQTEGVISKRGKSKDDFLTSIFGGFGPYKGAVKNYSEFQLNKARNNIFDIYGR